MWGGGMMEFLGFQIATPTYRRDGGANFFEFDGRLVPGLNVTVSLEH